jgi:hypothetical protein
MRCFAANCYREKVCVAEVWLTSLIYVAMLMLIDRGFGNVYADLISSITPTTSRAGLALSRITLQTSKT